MNVKQKTVMKYIWKALLLIITCLIAARITDVYNGSLSNLPSIWLPGGICIALVYLWGYQFLPVAFLSILLPFLLSGFSLSIALPSAAGIILETYLAVFLLKRIIHLDPTITHLKDVGAIIVTSFLVPFISSSLVPVVYYFNGLIDSSTYLPFWAFCWISDLLGILLVVPVILVWGTAIPHPLQIIHKRYDWIVIALVMLMTWFVFLQEEQTLSSFGTLTYLAFPFLFWISFRLFQRGTTLANLVFGLVAAAMMHFNGMGGSSFSSSMAMGVLDIFLIATISTSLIMAALFSEREIAKNESLVLNTKLEERVAQRTQELKQVNNQIKRELKSRESIETELRVSKENLRTIIENLPDAMILINSKAKIIDINNHMVSLFKVQREDVLNQFKIDDFSVAELDIQVLRDYLHRALVGEAVKFEWKARRPSDGYAFPVEIELIRIWLNKEPIIICSIRDMTDRIKMVDAEREQRVLAEALQNTAAALSSVLSLDEVFDRILKNVGKVVPHDAVNLMLIEDDIAYIVHSHGYKKLGMLDYIQNVRFDVNKTENFRVMIETGKPLIISDINAYPAWISNGRASWIQSYAGAPIRVKGVVIGFIQLDSGTPGYFNAGLSAQLQAFADQAAVAIENARLYTELQKLAITDPLTGLLNRHGFDPTSKREFEIARRYGRKISMILFDIDHLKNINDHYGHAVGDRSLKMIADCCRKTLREIDLVARFGGDEFIILLTEAALKSALEIAERLKQSIKTNLFEVDGEIVLVTISAGVAELKRGMKTLDELIDTADRGSYLAKSQGRNAIATIQSPSRQKRSRPAPAR
jgi:diguanylate cyclase (GGDEF)-like protein/PAS domain S-box-containing protein